MSHRAHLELGSAVSKKLSSAGRKRGSLRGQCGVRVLEALESRVLLTHSAFFTATATNTVTSATRIMYPDFILQRGTPDLLGSVEGFTPAQIKQAYGIDQVNFGGIAGNGAGQTIAIVDAYNDPTLRADLHTFDQQFGLSDPQLTIVNQTGGTTLPGTDPAGPGDSWAGEISLDVEWAHAVAPGANILLVLATSSSNSDLETAILTARAAASVSVVSMSFGGVESPDDPLSNNDFTTPIGHIGVTFVASAGDDGAFGNGGSTKSTNFPASSPNVVSVGGTRLTVNSNGTYASETGWGTGQSSGTANGGGGGVSKVESQPIYQKGVVTQTSIFRAVPDVAFDADPASGVAIVDSFDSPSTPWLVIGGTSLSAPMWAAVVAIADQGRTLAGEGTLDGATQTLPALYKLPSADFHDITVGNNGYLAGPGYDLVTGRGTPIVNLVVRDLVTPPGTVPVVVNGPVIGSLSIAPGTVGAGALVTLSAENVAELGSGTVSSVKFYEDTNGVQGFQLGSDLLIGTGTRDGSTWNFTFSTSNITVAGDYTFYAVATDDASVTSNTVAQSLTITAPTFELGVKTDTSLFNAPTPFGVVALTVLAGTPLTLTATNVTESGGTIDDVVFTRQLFNGSPSTTPIITLGSGIQSIADWTIGASTTGLAAGVYIFTATATDSAGISTSVTTAVAVKSSAVAPPNDSVFAAATLTGLSVSASGTNVGATASTANLEEALALGGNFIEESADPAIAGIAGGRSVWWTWTAPVNGVVSLSTAGSNFDTLLGVYTQSFVTTTDPSVLQAVYNPIAANDDVSQGIKTSGLTFNAVAGTSYVFEVDGYHGASGNITLNLSETPTGRKGTFSTPQVLPPVDAGTPITLTGTNLGIPAIIGQPKVAGKQGGGQVWFTWTAPSTRTVHLNTQGSAFDTLLGVYKGLALTALTKVASNDDVSSSILTSALAFKAIKGVTYRFVIDGYLGASGNYVLNMS